MTSTSRFARLRALALVPTLVGAFALSGGVVGAQADTPRPQSVEAPRQQAALGAPKAGSCYNVTTAHLDRASLTKKRVNCRTSHTLWMLGAPVVPASVDLAHPATAAFGARVTKVCSPLTRRAVGAATGRKWARSAYQPVFFVPTAAQRAKGARWISCGLAVPAATRTGLLSSRLPKLPKVTGTLPDKFTLCGTNDYRATSCAKRHSFRVVATAAVKYTGASTPAKVEHLAVRTCRARLGGTDWMWRERANQKQTLSVACLSRNPR